MTFLTAILLASLLVPTVALADMPPLLRDLVETAGFSKKDVERIGDGVLVKELEVANRSRRASFAGLVRIEGDGSGLADTLETVDLATIEGAVDGLGRFSNPPKPEDVAGIEFSDDEFEVLADCQVAQCKFKLDAEGVEAVGEIDWDSPDAGQVFTRLFRKAALDYVEAYRQKGSSALVVYHDKSQPVPVADTFARLMQEFHGFDQYAPNLAAYLRSYPQNRGSSMSDSIVWSVGDFGYRPTITIDHFVADRDPKMSGATALIVSKTIFASHYLAGRVQLAAVLVGPTALGLPGHYLLLIDEIEFDGDLNGFKRGLLGRRLRDDVEKRMKLLRALADGSG